MCAQGERDGTRSARTSPRPFPSAEGGGRAGGHAGASPPGPPRGLSAGPSLPRPGPVPRAQHRRRPRIVAPGRSECRPHGMLRGGSLSRFPERPPTSASAAWAEAGADQALAGQRSDRSAPGRGVCEAAGSSSLLRTLVTERLCPSSRLLPRRRAETGRTVAARLHSEGFPGEGDTGRNPHRSSQWRMVPNAAKSALLGLAAEPLKDPVHERPARRGRRSAVPDGSGAAERRRHFGPGALPRRAPIAGQIAAQPCPPRPAARPRSRGPGAASRPPAPEACAGAAGSLRTRCVGVSRDRRHL